MTGVQTCALPIYDRLHDQAGDGRGEPEQRKLALVRSEPFVDRRHIAHLQTPAELDSEESEGHVPDLPEREGRFVLHGRIVESANG